MRTFFFDTETTGMPAFGSPSDHPTQPHIVQFAGILVDDATDRVLAAINAIARPDGWEVPTDVAAIHGISNEMALDVGIAEATILRTAMDLWRLATRRVAHNEQFDAKVVRIACKRFLGEDTAAAWSAGKAECTARMATPLCKMPPTERMRAAGRFNFKTPKLSEAHEILLGLPLENAHNAQADVDGCRRIHRYMTSLQAATAEAVTA